MILSYNDIVFSFVESLIVLVFIARSRSVLWLRLYSPRFVLNEKRPG